MIVDPSRARGLRQAFWKHTSKQAVQTQKALTDVVARHKPNTPFSQKGFRRFASDLIQLIPASSLVLTKLEGRRQFVACMFLDHQPDHALNEWHEHVLVGYKGIFYRDIKPSIVTRSTARIGEHAVQRLFQRGERRLNAGGNFDLDSYAGDIKSAIAWAEMLWTVTDMLQQIHKKKDLSVFAPTASGAFVGQISSVGQCVDFRTFISLEKMFTAQRELWIALREVQEDVGIEHIGLNLVRGIARHSPSVKTILRLCETMDRFPETLMRTPEIPQSYESFVRTQLEGF